MKTYKYDGVNMIWQKKDKLLLIEQQPLRQLSLASLKRWSGCITKVVAVYLELVTLVNFDVFQNITELVLDNNWLTAASFKDLQKPMPNVTTLSINNNEIENAEELMVQIAEKFPNLLHLSCLCNRFETVNFLPNLRTLNGKKEEKKKVEKEITSKDIIENQRKQLELIPTLKLRRSSSTDRREKLLRSNTEQIQLITKSLQKNNSILIESYLLKRIDKNTWSKRYCRLYAKGKIHEYIDEAFIAEVSFKGKQVGKSAKARAFKIEYNGGKHLYRALSSETFALWIIKLEKWM